MSKYLVKTTEIYRVDSEEEAKQLIEQAKIDKGFILSKYVSEYKERAKGGEVYDSYWLTSLTKVFNDVKEPISEIDIVYKNAGDFDE